MIYLHLLGDTLIEVGEKEIHPTTPLVFAALLYLGSERGRRLSRSALQTLLFPNAAPGEDGQSHSLRQLLYKLKHLGVPLEADAAVVALPAAAVEDPFAALARPLNDPDFVSRLSLGFAPGYEPTFSEEFSRWLEDQRTAAAARIRTALVAELARNRESGNDAAVQRVAAALLKCDPLNEAATFAHAEGLALSGQKRDAVRVLEHYSAEVGRTSAEIRLPAEILKRRISHRFKEGERPALPLVGREDELARLLAQYARAASGAPTVSVVWGEAGVGKTRLVQELSAHLQLEQARVETAHCQLPDAERPLGSFIDLVPRLLEARGALGVSPKSLETLRRFSAGGSASGEAPGNPEVLAARIREAIVDLFACIAAEGPLVLVVEDAHWLDEASQRLLLSSALGRSGRVYLVLTRRGAPSFPEGTRVSESVFVRRLEPLGDAAAADLLGRAVGADFAVSEATRQRCLALGAGNPLFLCTIAEHLRVSGAAPSADATVLDLLRQRVRLLEARPLLLLRCVAALGTHGTQARLAACTGMATEAGLLALQDVADRGLVALRESEGEGTIKCAHDLIGQAVLDDAPAPIRRVIFERAAAVLEADGLDGKQIKVLWSCAELWTLAKNRERAVKVLRRCAEFALEIGQPVPACSALEKAQELSEESELPALVEETIRVAELAGDFEGVLRNVARYRAVLKSRGMRVPKHHHSELAEINALRRCSKPGWEALDVLRECALDAGAAADHRIRAARLFLIAAEQQFRKGDAVELYAALSAWPVLASDSFDVVNLRLLYNRTFGDMGRVRADCEKLLELVREQEEAVGAPWLVAIAQGFLVSGATDRAMQLCMEAARITEKLGMLNNLMFAYCQLADFCAMRGDMENRLHWQRRAEELFQVGGLGSDPIYLDLSFDLALRRGELGRARAIFEQLRAVDYVGVPLGNRLVRAFEIILCHREGTLDPARLDYEELEAMDERGRDSTAHSAFALALFLANVARGERPEAEKRMREYVSGTRRERFPIWPYYRGLVSDPDLAEELRRIVVPAEMSQMALSA